jgi:basic membrane lipoprotein Med (substrate-binding protein (PBP1-ABC) superfamily)
MGWTHRFNLGRLKLAQKYKEKVEQRYVTSVAEKDTYRVIVENCLTSDIIILTSFVQGFDALKASKDEVKCANTKFLWCTGIYLVYIYIIYIYIYIANTKFLWCTGVF